MTDEPDSVAITPDPLRIYTQVRTPPPGATRPIEAGRMKGSLSINPQWRMDALTAALGPCGEGWAFTVVDERLEAHGEERLWITRLELRWREPGGEWSAPIPGIGTAKLVAQESRGLHFDDAAPKKARTDALSAAMQPLGVGADVFRGLFDQRQERQERRGPPGPKPPPAIKGRDPVFESLFDKVHDLCLELGGGSAAEASKILTKLEMVTGKPVHQMTEPELKGALTALQKSRREGA